MANTIKRFTAVLITAIITATSFCASAFAVGTGSYTVNTQADSKGATAIIDYSNVSDDFSRVSGPNVYGTVLNTFVTGSATTYTLSFTPASGSATVVRFCDTDSTNEVASITIPKWVSGMPSTLTTTVTLDTNHYYAVKMKSYSSSGYTSGTFKIIGLSNILYI